MNGILSSLEPKKIFEFFELLCSVPHGSGNTGRIADLIEKFAVERGLKYHRDCLNNLILYKEGTAGYEGHRPVIIQGHTDMVCAADSDAPIDMKKDGLVLKTDGKNVWADRTSLGGDNCIAVAMAMAILDSEDIPHPPLECVFTVDEETGMDGAAGLDCSKISGRTMINLDSEDEGVFTVGCAGGLRLNFSLDTEKAELPVGNFVRKRVTVGGLVGGHSGAEINRGRANANKLLGRVLHGIFSSESIEDCGIYLCEMHGGKFDNVITPDAYADFILSESALNMFEGKIREIENYIRKEYETTDPDIRISVSESNSVCPPVSGFYGRKIVGLIFSLPQGVQEMSFDMPGLVETSCNLGILNLDGNGLRFSVSVRSSVGSRKRELAEKIEEIASAFGCSFSERGDYPGWKYSPVSPLRDIFAEEYKRLSSKDARIEAIHAGVECGFFADRLAGLDCVSLGPNIRDIHTSRETLEVDSVANLFSLVKAVLKRL